MKIETKTTLNDDDYHTSVTVDITVDGIHCGVVSIASASGPKTHNLHRNLVRAFYRGEMTLCELQSAIKWTDI